ncbi:hypothetical protein MNV49_004589 [Pseudohyphozyma bogoriensis]|nr:hypothetical protein MNV49_004589 [Pseudohyphozyma bogoriensis]
MPPLSAAGLLEAIVSAVPPGANPYAFLAEALHDRVYSSATKAFTIQVWTLTGLVGVILVISLLGLGVRFVRCERWLYRIMRTEKGAFVVPNASVCFLIYNSIYLILFIPYAFYGMRFSQGKGSLVNLILWKTWIFVPLWLAAWHIAWATALSGNLRQSPLLSTSQGPVLKAWVLNTYFISSAFLVPASVFPLEALASEHWNAGFETYETIQTVLGVAAAQWNGQGVEMDPAGIRLAQEFLDEMQAAVHWFNLRAQIKTIQQPPQVITLDDVKLHGGLVVDRARSSLERAFVNLVVTSTSLCLTVAIYSGIALWSALDAESQLASPSKFRLSYYLAMYTYVVFAGIACFALFLRSFSASTVSSHQAPKTTYGALRRKLSADFFKLTHQKNKNLQVRVEQTEITLVSCSSDSDTGGELSLADVQLPKSLPAIHRRSAASEKVTYKDGSESEDDGPVVRGKGKKKARNVVESDDGSDFEIISGGDEEEEDDEELEMDEDASGQEEGSEAASHEGSEPDDDGGGFMDVGPAVVYASSDDEGGNEDEDKPHLVQATLPGASKPRKTAAKPRTTKKKKGGDDDDDAEDDDPDNAAFSGGFRKGLDENLPPISGIPEIFKDLTARVQDELEEVVEHLNGRALTVATMCSGTESPLLALGLISDALKELTGSELKIKHIFSAEIEPFKQASLHRAQLLPATTFPGDDTAETAYGGTQPVPGGVDVLVAGTSCVDYSGLNSKKKTLADKGESGSTFFGMLDWVAKHRPPIVILENVSGAPWGDASKLFEKYNYSSKAVRVDTKNYYIPHTRTRGYMIAVPNQDNSRKNYPSLWAEKLDSLKRKASSPLESFLLPSDDPRIMRAREDLAIAMIAGKEGPGRARTDWLKCEARHHRARAEELLGDKRPMTAWQDGGGPVTVYDEGWHEWLDPQTDRVKDLMDINYLRIAKDMVDIVFKTSIWNLSQNVDRGTYSSVLGITPCLTPTGIPYLANRGGPVTGLEALSLQGLPIDSLMLTRESMDQLNDLAGNAMSSTVVGSAILAALIVAKKLLPRGEGKKDENEDVIMEVIEPPVDARIRGEDRLNVTAPDFSTCTPVDDGFLERARQSARKCVCEGRLNISTSEILRCTSCAHSVCSACQARPTHDFVKDTSPRLPPAGFEAELKAVLPMRFHLKGFSLDALTLCAEAQFAKDGSTCDKKLLQGYLEAIAAAVDGAEFHYQATYRRAEWAVIFGAGAATLELALSHPAPQWTLKVKADAALAVNHPVREALMAPVARLTLDPAASTLLQGLWEFRIPITPKTVPVLIENVGKPVPSWRASLGLGEFLEEQRSDKLKVTVTDGAALLDRPIDGIYELKPDCGTACNSLHRRTEPEEATPLFLFFDPTRSSEPDEDSFAFAADIRRLDFGTARPMVGSLPKGWMPSLDASRKPETSLRVSSLWSSLSDSSIELDPREASEGSTLSMPESTLELGAAENSCSFAENLLTAKVKLAKVEQESRPWLTEDWHEVDIPREGPEVFTKLAWIVARLPEWKALKDWQSLDDGAIHEDCTTCSPVPPELKWMRKRNVGTIVPLEDGITAGRYEQALKARPSPLLVHTRQLGGFFEFRIGLNVATLAHRALGALPAKNVFRNIEELAPTVDWRLISGDSVELSLGRSGLPPVFRLLSNAKDKEAEQPPHFKKLKLRPEQLRSLTWMLEQENNPTPWVEEEVNEALLTKLGWHAEVKATRTVTIRGGVLADAVGYGKTAISVGLVCAQRADDSLSTDPERIPLKATLTIVPPHLMNQWPSEIKRFASGDLNVISIKTMGDLKKYDIRDFKKADMIVCSTSLFNSDLYWDDLGDFSGSTRGITPDKSAGRYFRSCVEEAVAALPAQIQRLRNSDEGPSAVFSNISAARKARRGDGESIPEEAQRRLKGAALAFSKTKDGEGYNYKEAAKDDDGKAQKRKDKQAEAEKKKKAKAASRADPWGLKEGGSWKDMSCPVLSMFSFARLIIDEYTYLLPIHLIAIRALRAKRRWILSGTPPLKSFNEIRTIADLLHVHLGVDDEHRDVKSKGNESTAAELFHSFRDVHTKAWHTRRDEIAQLFLDRFARQNVAEIGEIPYSEQIVPIELPAAEMAIYRELDHHLLLLDANLKKSGKIGKKKTADRDVRLAQALGVSKSPEEALLKRCSHFTLDIESEAVQNKSARGVCDLILDTRNEQLEECKTELESLILVAAYMYRVLNKGRYFFDNFESSKKIEEHSAQPFPRWINEIFQDGTGDEDANTCLRTLCKEAGCDGQPGKPLRAVPVVPLLKTFEELDGYQRCPTKLPEAEELEELEQQVLAEEDEDDSEGELSEDEGKADSKKKQRLKKKLDEARTKFKKDTKEAQKKIDTWLKAHPVRKQLGPQAANDQRKARVQLLRVVVTDLRRLHKELAGRYRSQRYFECVRNTQSGTLEDAKGVALLSCCGHSGPMDEIKARALEQRCIQDDCRASVRTANVVDATTLLGAPETSRTFGAKLEQLVNIIDTIPEDDRILVFVQFDDLFAKVQEALESYGIPTAVIRGGAAKQSAAVEAFQDPASRNQRVLLLLATDASSAGTNLTIANWAFFISPLLADTQARYIAYETQAIGRLRRYGQLKDVKVFRLLTNATIDVKIFEERSGQNVASLLVEQEAEDPNCNSFSPTERPLQRVVIKTGVVVKRGKAAVNSKPEKKVVLKDVKPAPAKRTTKGKGKAKADSDTDDSVIVEEFKAQAKAVAKKPAPSTKAAAAPTPPKKTSTTSSASKPSTSKSVAPTKSAASSKSAAPAPSSTPAAASSSASKPPAKMHPFFNSFSKAAQPSASKRASTAADQGSSPSKRQKMTFAVVVPPPSPQALDALRRQERENASSSSAASTSNRASPTDVTSADEAKETDATSAGDDEGKEMEVDGEKEVEDDEGKGKENEVDEGKDMEVDA